MDIDRLFAVFALAAVVYGLALGDVFTTVLRWRRRRAGDPFVDEARAGASIYRWVQRAASVLAVLGLGCVGWAFYEPYLPEVTRVEIESPKLTQRIRVVQISDLHSDPKARLEERLPDIIRGLEPDLVVFTGDAINSPAGLPNFRRCMRRIAEICPTFGVRGNWEEWFFPEQDVFGGTGVRELDAQAAMVDIRGAQIWIAGAAVDHEARIDRVLARVPRDRFSIFLHHFPSLWRAASRGGIDLHLAGDTHGGQIALPGIGPLARIARHDGVFYPTGLQQRGGTTLYVNRGIGMEGGIAPRVRFGGRPEITLIELVPVRVR